MASVTSILAGFTETVPISIYCPQTKEYFYMDMTDCRYVYATDDFDVFRIKVVCPERTSIVWTLIAEVNRKNPIKYKMYFEGDKSDLILFA